MHLVCISEQHVLHFTETAAGKINTVGGVLRANSSKVNECYWEVYHSLDDTQYFIVMFIVLNIFLCQFVGVIPTTKSVNLLFLRS